MIDSTHDPLARQLPDEPHFVLLARDPLAPHMVALYAAVRGRRLYAVNDIVANLIVAVSNIPMHPTDDTRHAISAQQVGNAMRRWYYEHQPKIPTNARAVDLDALNQLEKEDLGTNAQMESPSQTQDPGAAPVIAPGSPLEIAT